jgi:hypothetical protein
MEEADKRQRVVQEIVQTEQTYVNRLQLLISVSPLATVPCCSCTGD